MILGKQVTALLLAATLALVFVAASPAQTIAQAGSTSATVCDQACLTTVMTDFLSAMTTGKTGAVPLAGLTEIRENTKVVDLGATTWKQVKSIRSVMTVADPVSGNVVSRAGVELADGKPGYLSTRLKVVAGGRIADVEISADTSPRVVAAYVWNLDPRMTAVLPPEQRMTRVALEALGRRYFHTLTTHVPIAEDYDEAACNRFHSGQQITNVASNNVEGGPARTCISSNAGNPPWGPATEQRFPIVDPERGLVLGITMLHYLKSPTQNVMYVSELFKVVGGKIVKIDNIGLMMQGLTTLGFTH